MSEEKGSRRQQEIRAIKSSITALEGEAQENPLGFSERDRVGQWKDFGLLYKRVIDLDFKQIQESQMNQSSQ